MQSKAEQSRASVGGPCAPRNVSYGNVSTLRPTPFYPRPSLARLLAYRFVLSCLISSRLNLFMT